MALALCELTGQLNQIHALHSIHVRRTLEGNDLYFGQPPLLRYIGEHEGCTQRELADQMQVSPSSIATSIKRMQKNRLVVKKEDPQDLRYSRLSLTDRGKALTMKCRADFDALDMRMYAGFSAKECKTLHTLLGRLIENLTDEEFRNKSFFSLIEQEKLRRSQREEETKGV